MYIRTIRAEEGPERDVGMGGSISLTIDAEGIVTVILYRTFKECASLRRLWVPTHGRLEGRQRRHKALKD